MKTITTIGLDKKGSLELAKALNKLLANYQLYYQNLRALHWNISGPHFFDLHVQFETQYNLANTHIDEVAERILTLGSTPLHTFSDYLKKAELKEAKNTTDAQDAVATVLDGLTTLIKHERKLLETADALGDEGTLSLVSDLLSEHEKTTWMFSAWQGK